ncbi:NifB/NifX family molybdenum-iron cluster-binding protein [Clostridium sediminicola]|uniref:NifB/NifX family molybdenum-iron cluster-binding protein n=1 Tax=Clostridium sediminicola TaxID=3114879 RepID=UPI0031F1FE1A
MFYKKTNVYLTIDIYLIDDHFGHCDYFTVFTVADSNKSIISEETIASPTGCGCKSKIAQILSDMGVSVMLAGNIFDSGDSCHAHECHN